MWLLQNPQAIRTDGIGRLGVDMTEKTPREDLGNHRSPGGPKEAMQIIIPFRRRVIGLINRKKAKLLVEIRRLPEMINLRRSSFGSFVLQ